MIGATTCKYFTGIVNERCDAQIKYASFGETSLPCIGKLNKDETLCEMLVLPTPEELAAKEAEFKKSIKDVMRAREAIVTALGPKRGGRGSMSCPICNVGVLHYSRAESNLHVHGRCSTEGCVAWME